jgi:hypothetical protein
LKIALDEERKKQKGGLFGFNSGGQKKPDPQSIEYLQKLVNIMRKC